MNNVQPIAPQASPAWPEVNAATAKSNMSAPQVGATEVPIRDSVIATGKAELPPKKTLEDTVDASHRDQVREWVGSQLEVRPGEVQKGLDWNSDPQYPHLNVLNGIATMFVKSAFSDGNIA